MKILLAVAAGGAVGALAWSPSEALRAFLVVGALAAFTTFSTFAMEAVLLGERHALGAAALYVAASVGLSVGGLVAGMRGLKWLLT